MRRGDVAARVVVAIVVVGTLFVLPDGFVDRATALAWTQTSQTDFEAGVAWNVDTAGSPGDVTLIPSPTDWIKDAANPVFEGQSAWDFTSVFPGTILHDGATYRMWFDGQGSAVGIGVATSPDGRLWTEDPANPIFTGTLGWESGVVVEPTVLREANGTYSMWYRGGVTGAAEIGKAWSPDGLSWTRWAAPVLLRTAPWESSALFQPSVILDNGTYKMWYVGFDGYNLRIGYAESPDGERWTKSPFNPLGLSGPAGSWNIGVGHPHVVREPSGYRMWYVGCPDGSCGPGASLGLATSGDGIVWINNPNNPVIAPRPSGWDSLVITTPAVYQARGGYQVVYTGCEASSGRCRWGLASAAYAERFVKAPTNPLIDVGPVGSWDEAGIRQPTVIRDGGLYRMWYFGSDGANGRIGYAVSADGVRWTKPLLALHAYAGSLATNIVLDLGALGTWDDSDLLTPTVIWDGSLYQMWYGGSDGTALRIGHATSPDGINWTKSVIGRFDYGGDVNNNIALDLGSPGQWDELVLEGIDVQWTGSNYTMWYSGRSIPAANSIGAAFSVDGRNWTRYGGNPVLTPQGLEGDVEDVTVHFQGASYSMWYEGLSGAFSRFYLATSGDGLVWARSPANPVMEISSSGDWDGEEVRHPDILVDSGTYTLWYSGRQGGAWRAGRAVSEDGVVWTKRAVNPVFTAERAPAWDAHNVDTPHVLSRPNEFWMYYQADEQVGGTFQVGLARSPDGLSWTREPSNPVLPAGSGWEAEIVQGSVLPGDSGYEMWYTAWPGTSPRRIGFANSSDGATWMRRTPSDPVLDVGPPGEWDDSNVYGASGLRENGEYRMWYGGDPDGSTYRGIGYATSTDGTNWARHPGNPVLQAGALGAFDESGVHPGQVIRWGPVLVMAYLGLQGGEVRVGLATSLDGVAWVKNALNPVLTRGQSVEWDGGALGSVALALFGGVLNLWYRGTDGTTTVYQIGHASANPRFLGTLESQVFDSGAIGTTWDSLSWNATMPPDTNLSLAVRAGDTPDLTAAPWGSEIVTSGLGLSLPRSRYFQYRATLVSLSGVDTPVLHDVTVNFTGNSAAAPLLQSPPDGSWTSNPMPSFAWTFMDPDGDPQGGFRVEIDDDPGFLSVDYASGDISSPLESWASLFLADGCWYWRVRTYDVFGGWGPYSGAWQVCVDATPPVADAGPDIAITEGNVVAFDGSGSFDARGIVNHTWTFPYGGPTVTRYGATFAFTFDLLGTFVVTLTVRDPLGLMDTGSLDVTVTTLPPTARILFLPGVGDMGTSFQFDGETSTDADGTVVSWSWDFGDGEAATGPRPSHAYGRRGSFVVTLTVMDEDGATDAETTTVPVRNRVPTADAGVDQTAATGEDVTLTGAGSRDLDGDELAYAWSQVGGPSVTLTGASTSSATFRPSQAGTYTFEIVVEDGYGGSATDRIVVTVSETRTGAEVTDWLGPIIVILGVILIWLLFLWRKRRKPAEPESVAPEKPSDGSEPLGDAEVPLEKVSGRA